MFKLLHVAQRRAVAEAEHAGFQFDEVRRFCVEAEEGSLPSLDISGLSFVDRRGAEILQQLRRQGVRIHACSSFVAELLHWDRKPNP
jgi:hypothetical protein